MTGECFDCGIIKKGVKPIKYITPDYEYLGEKVSFKRWLGKNVCRSCNNFKEGFDGHYSTNKPVKSGYCC